MNFTVGVQQVPTIQTKKHDEPGLMMVTKCITPAIAATILLANGTMLPLPVSAQEGTEARGTNAIPKQYGHNQIYEKSYALVIGVNEYKNGWKPLRYPVKDAIEVTEALKQHGFEVMLLKNPTRSDFVNAFDHFFSSYGVSESNRLLIYFAGHGYTYLNINNIPIGNLVFADAARREENASGFHSGAFDMQTLKNKATASDAKHILIVLDCCFSGAIFDGTRGSSSGPPPSLHISAFAAHPARQLITAGTEYEVVPDSSIFKVHFLRGIRGCADWNRDSFIIGTELGEYVRNNVVNGSRGNLHPQFGELAWQNIGKGEFIFDLRGKDSLAKQDTCSGWPMVMGNQDGDFEPRHQTPLKFGHLIIQSPYQARFYVDGKLAQPHDDTYLETILLPNIYRVKVVGEKGYEYKEDVFIRDGEKATVRPLKIRSGF